MSNTDEHSQALAPRRIPADVDAPDRVLAGLTARQLAILAGPATLLIVLWQLTRAWMPIGSYLAIAAPMAVAALVLALVRHRDGMSLDAYLWAALAYWLRRRRTRTPQRPAHRSMRTDAHQPPDSLWGDPFHSEPGFDSADDGQVPDWLARRVVGLLPDPFEPARTAASVAPQVPIRDITQVEGEAGVVDLGSEGVAVLAAVATVPFAWASPAQQHAVLAGFARLLCAVELPMQILLRAVPLQLQPALDELAHATATLPHPALAQAATDHHDYLSDLDAHAGLLARQVIVVLRDPTPHRTQRGGAVARASERLLRSLQDARAAVATAGVELITLDAAQTAAILASCTRPSQQPVDTGPSDDQWDAPAHTSVAGVASWLPEQLDVGPRIVATRDKAGATEFSASLAILGYPRQVYPGWLTPLLTYPARLDVSLHIDPVPTAIAARRLRQQLARLESTRAINAERGRLADPHTDTAASDAEELAARLARGDTRLHRLGLYLTVHATSEHQLGEQLHAVRALTSSMLLDARLTPYRALQAWTSTLPIGIDALGRCRVMDTDALATTIPLASMDLPAGDPATATPPSGVLYGQNLATAGLVIHDRFAAPNHNAVILAASGAGKSYLSKLELLRSLYRGVQVIVIDPEDEYARLAHHVGGTHLRLGAPGIRINPLDLPHTAAPTHREPGAVPPVGADVLTRRALYLHTVLGVMLGELNAHERVLADRAIHTTYTRAGITYDPATWTRPAPLLADLAESFRNLDDPTASDLAHRLEPYTTGSFRTLFDGPTTTPPAGHLIVFSLKDLPDQLRALGTLAALDATWRTIAHPDTHQPRLVVVDEAWLLLQHPAGAQFLLRLAKAARKHWTGLTLITQDATDLLATDLGRAVISNAATHILLRTAPQAAARIAAEYQLTEPEREFLTTATTGTGLLITHTGHHIPFAAEASPHEDTLATTNPAQLATLTTTPTAADHPATPPWANQQAGMPIQPPAMDIGSPIGLLDDDADPL